MQLLQPVWASFYEQITLLTLSLGSLFFVQILNITQRRRLTRKSPTPFLHNSGMVASSCSVFVRFRSGSLLFLAPFSSVMGLIWMKSRGLQITILVRWIVHRHFGRLLVVSYWLWGWDQSWLANSRQHELHVDYHHGCLSYNISTVCTIPYRWWISLFRMWAWRVTLLV